MSIKDFFKYHFTKPPTFVDYEPEDWIVDENIENWTRTRVVVPKIVHRHRAVKSIVSLGSHPWRLVHVYDDEQENLFVKYAQTNYPLEPRVPFRIEFW